jgi:hypothetical protein
LLANFLRRGKQFEHPRLWHERFARVAAGASKRIEVHSKGRTGENSPARQRLRQRRGEKFTRLPFGHPEAFIEAFANIYLEAVAAIRASIEGKRGGKSV